MLIHISSASSLIKCHATAVQMVAPQVQNSGTQNQPQIYKMRGSDVIFSPSFLFNLCISSTSLEMAQWNFRFTVLHMSS